MKNINSKKPKEGAGTGMSKLLPIRTCSQCRYVMVISLEKGNACIFSSCKGRRLRGYKIPSWCKLRDDVTSSEFLQKNILKKKWRNK